MIENFLPVPDKPNEWFSSSYYTRRENTEPIKSKNFKSFDYRDCHNYDNVMLYPIRKLFSKLEHIKISALFAILRVL